MSKCVKQRVQQGRLHPKHGGFVCLIGVAFVVVFGLLASGCSTNGAAVDTLDSVVTSSAATSTPEGLANGSPEYGNGEFQAADNATSQAVRSNLEVLDPSPAPDVSASPPSVSVLSTATPLLPARDCTWELPDFLELTYESLADASMQMSQAGFECADEVGLALAADDAAIAALRELGIAGPLLLVDELMDSTFRAEVERLAPQRILVSGFAAPEVRKALGGMDLDVLSVQRMETYPPATAEPAPTQEAQASSQETDGSQAAETDGATNPQAAPEDSAAPAEQQGPEQAPVDAQPVWIIGTPELEPILEASFRHMGEALMISASDFRAASPTEQAALLSASELKVIWTAHSPLAWPIGAMREGLEIPGGGLFMFDGGVERRMVAMYGHPSGPALGVLGEQGIEAGIERLNTVTQGYEADGSVVLPTFEIIATVASAHAGADGDYSAETPLDDLRPWVAAAAENDVYVVLDLQPGRNDYLSQAKIYEEFLRLPHVGLALDPEWRLKPDQRHLRQIGTVDAAEINTVVEWLADIVRQENLPQKLLILHQFSTHMITNPHLIQIPPELAVLIHMDGQGYINEKYGTWNRLTSKPSASRFHWGWKNFYDEDSPTPTPAQVLALEPKAVYVSYQ
ncbi:MAG: hypothetical protein OXE04_08760 [bacterium]|nr:hypothetical protein [bacterium]